MGGVQPEEGVGRVSGDGLQPGEAFPVCLALDPDPLSRHLEAVTLS